MDRQETVLRAVELVDNGRYGDAKRVLLELRGAPEGLGSDAMGFVALRTLARCYREDREFDLARDCAEEALGLARAAQSSGAEALILEGLALIESGAGNLKAAARYFMESAACEQARGELPAMAAALSNYAHMLVVNELEGAEHLLAQAYAVVQPDSVEAGSVADNMASEFERQGRHGDAVEWGQRAVGIWRGLEAPLDLFAALRNLARHLRDAGRTDEGASVFVEAHDLIHTVRLGQIDDAHYEGYPSRVAAIEEASYEKLASQGDSTPGLAIGVHAMLGEQLLEEGMKELEAGNLGKAVESLGEARKHWQALDAWHRIVVVDHHAAYALIEMGNRSAALDLAHRVRDMARSLGDAHREAMALSLLIMLDDLAPAEDPLDYLAQARALAGPIARQLGHEPSANELFDGGVFASAAARICDEAKAYDLADRYIDETIRQGRALPEGMRHRLAYRLHNFYFLLLRTERQDRAAAVLDELRTVVATLGPDPRAARLLLAATVRHRFVHDGDRSQETLDGLLKECEAYEQLREQARGPAPLGGFAAAIDPPYEEAAEVAVALDRPALALSLLERGKARTLFEAMNIAPPPAPDPQGGDPAPPSLGDAVGLELFVTTDRIGALVTGGGVDGVRWMEPTDGSGDRDALVKLLRALSDDADSERGSGVPPETLHAVLADPVFRGLSRLLLTAVPEGRAGWVAPHRFLHGAPLQLSAEATGSPAAVPWSIVPALPLARALERGRIARAGWTVASCGDPHADLPFARIEALLVADVAGPVAVGPDATVAWIEEQVADERLGILHLACHGRFDRGHPERSGLLLAAEEQGHFAGTQGVELMSVERVAALPLEGVVVVLSACSSGLEAIRDGDEPTGLVSALLTAGAPTIIAAQWPINDLSAMLLMVAFYELLRAQQPASDLGDALAGATAGLRSLSALALFDRGFELADSVTNRGGATDHAFRIAAAAAGTALTAMGDTASAGVVAEIVRSSPPGSPDSVGALRALRPPDDARSAVAPFAGPDHWGALAIVGRSHA